MKKDRVVKSQEDITNIKNRIFAFPQIKKFFEDLGVEQKYVNELVELFEYQYIEEGDDFISPGN